MRAQKSAAQYLLPKTQYDVWERGQEYASKVTVISQDERHIEALVSGTKTYPVRLRFAGGGIGKHCDCPARYDVCKHMVAVTIVWDTRRGLHAPSTDDIKTKAAPKPDNTLRQAIKNLFADPLHADLEFLRIMADTGSWSRPHSRLPKRPPVTTKEEEPLTLHEISLAFKEITHWSKRKAYDPYFCAGEMTAAFCEMLRIVRKRLSVSSPTVCGEILCEAQKFHYVLVQQLMDDSDGLHVFSEAHLEDIYQALKALPAKELDKYLQEFDAHREDY